VKFLKGYKTPDGRSQPSVGYQSAAGQQGLAGYGASSTPEHDPLRMARELRYPDYNDTDLPADQALPPEYKGEPVVLSSSVLVQSNTAGVQPSIYALRNPLTVPIEIHQIKFFCRLTSPTQLPPPLGAGPIIGVQLLYGSKNISLTQGVIPLNLLSGADVVENVTVRESASDITAGGQQNYSFYTVKLRHPIWLAPGELITPMFTHAGQINQPILVDIAFCGRVLSKKAQPPRRIRLPFFSAFLTPIFPQSDVYNFVSTEKQLVNPSKLLLHVDQFIGQISLFPQYGAANDSGSTDNFEAIDTGTGSTSDSIRVGMVNSDGYPTIPVLTPFRLAFDLWTRVLAAETDLPPNGYYIATIDCLTPVGATPPVDRTQMQVGIGMRGWYEIPADEALP
jgi:hypothetical protein